MRKKMGFLTKMMTTMMAASMIAGGISSIPVHAAECEHEWVKGNFIESCEADCFLPKNDIYNIKCSKCGEEDLGYIFSGEKLSHEFDSDGNCEKCGLNKNSEYDMERDAMMSDMSEYIQISADSGESGESSGSETHEHNWVYLGVDHIDATCLEGSFDLETYVCSCGENNYVKTNQDDVLGDHDIDPDEGVCISCGKTIEELGIPKHEHDWTVVNTKHVDATCERESYDLVSYHCDGCGQNMISGENESDGLAEHDMDEAQGICKNCKKTYEELGLHDPRTDQGQTTNPSDDTTATTATKPATTATKPATTPAKKITVSKPVVKKVANKKGKKLYVNWKKVNGISNYQIQYSTKSNFKKATTKNVSSKATTFTKKLSKGKTYYVRMRSCKKVNGKNYYSAWTATKKVKIKK